MFCEAHRPPRQSLPPALAAPVDEGMMFCEAHRPPRQSLPPRDGPSTVSCVAVMAWTVVIKPSRMPNLASMHLATGAKQLVVHEALETMLSEDLYSKWFTPITYIGASGDGAEMITFLHPPAMWAAAFSCDTRMSLPLTTRYSIPPSSFIAIVPLKRLWT